MTPTPPNLAAVANNRDVKFIGQPDDPDPRTPGSPQFVEYTRPRCPECQSLRLLAQHSDVQDDGTVFRLTRCANCGRSVTVIAR